MLRSLIVLAVVAGCGEQTGSEPLLSASRLTLGEGETARIHVAVARSNDFEVVAPDGLVITPVEDAFGPGFDLTPTCGAAASANSDLVVEVRDRKRARNAALVVAVRDDGTDACAAHITMWLEPCTTAACAEPCTMQADSTQLTLARAQRARLCIAADALDPSRPLANEQLTISPPTSAFRVLDARTAIIEGADWLVGPFRATFTATAGAIPVARTLPLDIGAAGDIGIEIGSSGVAVALISEFARTTRAVTVHRFPVVGDACEISTGAAVGDTPVDCATGNYRLYDAIGNVAGGCAALPCGPSAHATFSLSFVPQIEAAAVVRIPVRVATAQDTTAGDAVFDGIASRAENLASATCTGSSTMVACADIDGDGSLDVVVDSGADTCVYSLVGWRDPLVMLQTGRPDRILSTESSTVLGISSAGAAGATLSTLVAMDGGWSWQSLWTSPALQLNAQPLRRATAGPPDHLVGVDGNTIYFVSLAGQPLGGGVTPADLPAGSYSIGVVDVVGDGDDLVLVGFDPTDPFLERQKIWIYRIDWSQSGASKSPALGTAYATGTITGMPTTFRSIARRRAISGNDEVVVAFRGGTFASAVAELAVAPGSLSLLTQFGSVRSVASAPDGSVLYGQEGGARRSIASTTGTIRTAIDPIVELAPELEYGGAIAACVGSSSFVVQTGDHQFRAAQLGIVPETP